MKIQNLKLVILLEYQNIKTLKLSKFLWLRKIKNTVTWTYGNGDVKWEEIVEKF